MTDAPTPEEMWQGPPRQSLQWDRVSWCRGVLADRQRQQAARKVVVMPRTLGMREARTTSGSLYDEQQTKAALEAAGVEWEEGE